MNVFCVFVGKATFKGKHEIFGFPLLWIVQKHKLGEVGKYKKYHNI